jgi:CheY-like chemotaxis protein
VSRPPRLYVVDDAASICAQIATWAGDAGAAVDVEVLASARALLRRAEYDPPDLALVDLTLPGLDGRTALRQLRRGHFPVVLLSPTTREAARGAIEGLLEGAADCVWKRRHQGSERLVGPGPRVLRRLRLLALGAEAPDGGPVLDLPPTGGPAAPVIALGSTAVLQVLLRRLALLPERPAGGALLGLPLPRAVGPTLAECAARFLNRPVLVLQDGEVIRAGQWRVIPGGCHALAVPGPEGTRWRLLRARGGAESDWGRRQAGLLDRAAPGGPRAGSPERAERLAEAA